MTPISCCGPLAYRIRPDRTFECPECGSLLLPQDIDLDGGPEVWAVDADGTLCTVTAPRHSLESLLQAVEEYLEADLCPSSEYSRRSSIGRMRECLGDYAEARRLGIEKPVLGAYTSEMVSDAANGGADLIIDSLNFGELESDAINLVVSAIMTCLDHPAATFEDVAEENYSDTADEIRNWWGWGK